MPYYAFTWNDAPANYFAIEGYIVEFGDQGTSPADVVIASANNISSANISVEFLNCSPDHRIVARGDSGSAAAQHRISLHSTGGIDRRQRGASLQLLRGDDLCPAETTLETIRRVALRLRGSNFIHQQHHKWHAHLFQIHALR